MCEWNIVVVIEIVCSFIIILFLLFSLNVCDPTEWLVVVDLNSIQYVYISLHWTVWVSEQSVARTQRMLQIFLFFSSFYFYFFCRLNCFYVLFCFLCMSVWAEHVYIQNNIHSSCTLCWFAMCCFYIIPKSVFDRIQRKWDHIEKARPTFACICIIFILNAVHNLMQIGRLLFPARQNLCSSFTGLLPVALRFEWTTKQRNLFYLIHVFQLLISGFTLFTCYLCSAEAVSRERVWESDLRSICRCFYVSYPKPAESWQNCFFFYFQIIYYCV